MYYLHGSKNLDIERLWSRQIYFVVASTQTFKCLDGISTPLFPFCSIFKKCSFRMMYVVNWFFVKILFHSLGNNYM